MLPGAVMGKLATVNDQIDSSVSVDAVTISRASPRTSVYEQKPTYTVLTLQQVKTAPQDSLN